MDEWIYFAAVNCQWFVGAERDTDQQPPAQRLSHQQRVRPIELQLERANMADNDEAGGSGKPFWELSQEMEEEPHRYEDAAEDTDPDYTTPSGVEDYTTDGAAGDATTDDGSARTDGSQPKRQRKDRRPNVLGTVKEEFIEVSLMTHKYRGSIVVLLISKSV
ncbi:uncharacterized protein [Aegilops tauschii subsp. strangulata]|uniref:uncharacterized protein isoform X2 n=1 Tax=Aegilops tauschii subsp. strangulata TaxID=200361 RepID=UPI003CC85F0B